MGNQYAASDVWVLTAVILASKNEGGTLMNIVAYGDAINHAIFRPEEIESGLSRLVKEGWIRPSGDLFQPTEKTLTLYSKFSDKAMSDLMSSLAGAIGIPRWHPNDPCPDPKNILRYHDFTQESFDKAVHEYKIKKKPKK